MEKIPLRACLFLGMILTANRAFSDTASSVRNIIKKHHFNESTLGLYVEEDGKKILDVNAEKLMIPASLTKIVTGGAILTKIPLNKKFVTELLSKGAIDNETLKGSLCFKGGGDPSFVSEKMWYLVNEFTRTGIKNIEGDLVIDGSRFDNEIFDSGRESTRVDRAFDAPISAVSFNWNSVNIFVRPGVAGGPAKVFLDPVCDYLELVNQTRTVEKSGVKSIEATRVKSGDKDRVVVSGNISASGSEVVIYKSISNPVLWTGSHLKEFLSERGIIIKGKVTAGECEADSKVLASSNSKNLNEIASDMLKFSNNFVAEMLVKNLAADDMVTNPKGKNASMKDGIEGIKSYLDKLGFARKDYVLENVSGLTRGNRFTPKQLASVLANIKNDFLIFPEFLSGLPIAGVDGTMKNRLKGDANMVRAKTGYLDGVVGLAGYIGRKNRSPLIFTFIFNGGYEQGMAARPMFDDLINELEKI
ncbi:MAG: D-alanyl-D-alanine carboxypeptidase/D-alanyl-D-alanine-endopeptidase [Bacteriovorax sp.]|nr:D-alanyl-D-alanine carboxypeptidase/D-alanyl-D-alanine-endopeptidase [Bacteriovorax sp.]